MRGRRETEVLFATVMELASNASGNVDCECIHDLKIGGAVKLFSLNLPRFHCLPASFIKSDDNIE